MGIPYHIRLDDAAGAQFPYRSLEDGAHLTLGSSVVEIIAMHTPGHTPGSTSLLVNDQYLLTGDTLFVSGIGRPDLGDKAEEWAQLLYRTLFDRIARLPDDVLILPAHYSGVAEIRHDGIVATPSGTHGGRIRYSRAERNSNSWTMSWAICPLNPQSIPRSGVRTSAESSSMPSTPLRQS